MDVKGLKSDKTLVAAIDIGNSYSCCAFSFKHKFERNPLEINTKTCNNRIASCKEPTVILFNPSKDFDSFGYTAREKYAKLVRDGAHKDWYFFAGFKTQFQKATRDTEIQDEHGKAMKADVVLTAAIKYLKDSFVELLIRKNTGLDNSSVFWVLTVPTICTESTRRLITECALGAGIQRSQLSLVSESEAASWHFRIPSVDRSTAYLGKYILVDLGGETIDITAYHATEGGLKEIQTKSWKDRTCFDGFFQMLSKILGAPVLKQFKEVEREDYLDFQIALDQALRAMNDSSRDVITLKVPLSLKKMYEEEVCQSAEQAVELSCFKDKVKWHCEKMRIDKNVFIGCFHAYTEKVVGYLQEVLRDPQVLGTELVLMVGGISDSKLMVHAIKTKYPSMRVFAPNDAWLTVTKGAVIYGHLLNQPQLDTSLYLPVDLDPAGNQGPGNLAINLQYIVTSSDIDVMEKENMLNDMTALLSKFSGEQVKHTEQLQGLEEHRVRAVEGFAQVDKLLKEKRRFEEEIDNMIRSVQISMASETKSTDETIQKLLKDQKLLEYRVKDMNMQFESSCMLFKERETQQTERYKQEVMQCEEKLREMETQIKADVENISGLTKTIKELKEKEKYDSEKLRQMEYKHINEIFLYRTRLENVEKKHELQVKQYLKTIDNHQLNIKVLTRKVELQEQTMESEKRRAAENLQNLLFERDKRIEDTMRRNENLSSMLKEKDALILNQEEQTSHNKTFHDLRVQQMEVKLKQYASEEVKYKKQIRDIEEQHLVQIESMQQQLDAMYKMKETMDKREESMLKNIEILKGMIALENGKGEDSVQRDSMKMGDRQSEGAALITTNELSDPNRATGLSERYKQLYKEEWSSAFEALTDEDDKKCLKQKQAATLLLELLKECVAFCDKTSKKHVENLRNIFLHPLRSIPAVGGSAKGDHKDIATAGGNLDASLRELRRKIAVQQGVVEEIKQVFLDEARSWENAKKGFDPEHIKTCTPYLGKCVELCWMMVLQDPPLLIKFDFKNGEKFDSSIYTGTMYSASGDKIDYLVWPPLYNGEPGELLAKGVVELI